ncbi:MAG: Gfo/Idh/MocA family oxidoreductase [Victivallales bacterium]|nr:Gfo/Idh/MocA family oxidoreductase [Victivallales bacterium]
MPSQTEHNLPNVGLVGIGGYGRTHYNFYLKLMDEGKMRFTGAVVLPHLMQEYADQVAVLHERHIPIYPSDDALLEAQRGTLDLVGLPVGIAAHRPLTCKFLDAGINVFVEKPLAGCLADADAIIETARRTGKFVAVGYHNMYSPDMHLLKKTILSGEYGRLLSVKMFAEWPRADTYYARNNWAGMAIVKGQPVYDSPLNNALAHYLNIPLFCAGDDFATAAHAVKMQAELVRARQSIETFDTCGVRIITHNGVTILLLQTHACGAGRNPRLHFQMERGHFLWELQTKTMQFFDAENHLVHSEALPDFRIFEFNNVIARIHDPSAFIYTPENSREQLFCIEKMHQNFPIHNLHSNEYQIDTGHDNQYIIPGISEVFDRCYANGLLPSEAGATWSSPVPMKDII